MIFDRADTTGGAEAVWTLSAPAISAAAGGHRIDATSNALDVLRIFPSNATSEIVDWPTEDADMNGGARLDVRDTAAAGEARFLFVLAPSGAITSAALTGTGFEVGVTIDFASGAHAEIVFDRDAVGPTALYAGPGSEVLFDGTFAQGVDDVPSFASD